MSGRFVCFCLILLGACQGRLAEKEGHSDDSAKQAASIASKILKPDTTDGSFNKLIDTIIFSPTLSEEKNFLPLKSFMPDTTHLNDSICRVTYECVYPHITIRNTIKSEECRSHFLIAKENYLSINQQSFDLNKMVVENGKYSLGNYYIQYCDWKKFKVKKNEFLEGYLHPDHCMGDNCLFAEVVLFDFQTKHLYTFSVFGLGGYFSDINQNNHPEFVNIEFIEGLPYVRELKTTVKITLYELNSLKQHFELMHNPQGKPYFIEISFDNGLFAPHHARITNSHWFKFLPK